MSACIGATGCGGKGNDSHLCQRAGSYVGMLYMASGTRLPIVMACVNRTLSGPRISTMITATPWGQGIQAGFSCIQKKATRGLRQHADGT